jgi:hypothetical protein
MRTVLIGAAMLGFSTASATAAVDAPKPAVTPEAMATSEGGSGSGSVKLASAVASTFLFVPDAGQASLVAVGEGGEGGRGRRWRKHHRPYGHYYGSRRYRPSYHRPYYARPYYGRPYYDHRYYGRPRFSYERY